MRIKRFKTKLFITSKNSTLLKSSSKVAITYELQQLKVLFSKLRRYIFIYTFTIIAYMQRLVSIPKSDLESLQATIETLENKYVMEQLEDSEKDIESGRVRNIEKLIKELEG